MNIFALPNCISFLCPVTVLRLQPEKKGVEEEDSFIRSFVPEQKLIYISYYIIISQCTVGHWRRQI